MCTIIRTYPGIFFDDRYFLFLGDGYDEERVIIRGVKEGHYVLIISVDTRKEQVGITFKDGQQTFLPFLGNLSIL